MGEVHTCRGPGAPVASSQGLRGSLAAGQPQLGELLSAASAGAPPTGQVQVLYMGDKS